MIWKSVLVSGLVAAASTTLLSHWHTAPVAALGPNVIVAEWNGSCVTSTRWATYGIEDLVKQTLPNEWIDGWRIDALRAGASVVRQDYWYFLHHSDPAPFCTGVTPYSYDMRNSRMRFVEGSAGINSARATDETVTKGWAPFGSASADNMYLSFRDGFQFDTQTQALTYSWLPIVASNSYPPGEYAPGSFQSNHPEDIGASTPLGSACLYDCTLDYDGDGVLNFFDNCSFAPNASQANNDAAGGYPWIKDGNGAEGSTIGGDACDANDDNDGCPDAQELGPDWHTGGQRDTNNPWDFFDVPVGPLLPSDITGARDKVVGLSDVLADLQYSRTSAALPNRANANGAKYGSDLNGNGIVDGVEYDRSEAPPAQPWRSGSPDGSVGLGDALLVLAQAGTNCH